MFLFKWKWKRVNLITFRIYEWKKKLNEKWIVIFDNDKMIKQLILNQL